MRTIRQLMRPQNMPHGLNGWIDAKLMPRGHDPIYARAVALLDLRPEDDLLDVACGVGVLLQRQALAEMRRVPRPAGRAVLTMGMRFSGQQARERFASLDFWAPTEAEAEQAVRDSGLASPQISYFAAGGEGPLAGLMNWFSRTYVGSDETRLVRAVAGD